MPELPNYVHIYSIIWVTWESFVGDVMDRNYDAVTFILKNLHFKKAWSSQFCLHHIIFVEKYHDHIHDQHHNPIY